MLSALLFRRRREEEDSAECDAKKYCNFSLKRLEKYKMYAIIITVSTHFD